MNFALTKLVHVERLAFRIQQTVSYLRVLDRAHKSHTGGHDVQIMMVRL